MDDLIEPRVAEPHPTAAAPTPSAAPHHVFLIDGSGFIFRAYFARAKDPTAERFQRFSSNGTGKRRRSVNDGGRSSSTTDVRPRQERSGERAISKQH